MLVPAMRQGRFIDCMDETVTESFEFGIDAENFGANEKSSHDTLEGL